MVRAVWRRQQHDTFRTGRDTVNGRAGGGKWRDPHQKHVVDVIEARVERRWCAQITGDDFDVTGQIGGLRIARQRADGAAGHAQLRDEFPSDVACCAGDENRFQRSNRCVRIDLFLIG